MALGEGACRVRRGSAPQVLAALRDAAVYLLEGVPAPSQAAATRHFAACAFGAIPLLLT